MEVSGWGPGGRCAHESGREVPNTCPQVNARAHSVGVTGCGEPPDSPAPFPIGRVLEHLSNLSREVSLDYERSMNKISFDQIVSSKPDTFSYVTLPEKEEEKVPRQGEGGWTKAGPVATHVARALPLLPVRWSVNLTLRASSPAA